MTMQSKIIFQEVQRFRQLWLWIIILASTLPVVGVLGNGMVQQLLLGNQWGNRPMSNIALCVVGAVTIVLCMGVLVMFWFTSLVTEVREDGLFIRFIPFHRSFVRIELEGAEEVKAKTYSPLKQYGGWGVRYGQAGKAYNVSGKQGVMITFGDTKTLLIGSQKVEELEAAIKAVCYKISKTK